MYPGATAALIGSDDGVDGDGSAGRCVMPVSVDPAGGRAPDRREPSQRRRRYGDPVIFKRVGEGRPYPEHDLAPRDWAALPPRPVRLDELVTTKDTLQLAALLDEDSTFFGDLFAHVVEWNDELYLEDGLHRALRAALQQRLVLHARVHTVRG